MHLVFPSQCQLCCHPEDPEVPESRFILFFLVFFANEADGDFQGCCGNFPSLWFFFPAPTAAWESELCVRAFLSHPGRPGNLLFLHCIVKTWTKAADSLLGGKSWLFQSLEVNCQWKLWLCGGRGSWWSWSFVSSVPPACVLEKASQQQAGIFFSLLEILNVPHPTLQRLWIKVNF